MFGEKSLFIEESLKERKNEGGLKELHFAEDLLTILTLASNDECLV